MAGDGFSRSSEQRNTNPQKIGLEGRSYEERLHQLQHLALEQLRWDLLTMREDDGTLLVLAYIGNYFQGAFYFDPWTGKVTRSEEADNQFWGKVVELLC